MRIEPTVQMPDGDSWPPERRQADAAGFQAALQGAKGVTRPIRCCCRYGVDLPLYVSRRGDTLHLARYPSTGSQHRADCRFYEAPTGESGKDAYDVEDLAIDADGQIRVRLAFPLTRNLDPRPRQEQPEEPSADRRATKPTMTELGLLHLLWEYADLNVWHPKMEGRRSWAVVNNCLRETMTGIRRSKDELSKRLVIIPGMRGPNLHAQGRQDFVTKVRAARSDPQKSEALIIIGQLRDLKRGLQATSVTLQHSWDESLSLFCDHRLATNWLVRFPDVERHLESPTPGDRIIALLIAEVRERGPQLVGDILSGAMMLTTAEFIPFASSYERSVARRLVDQGRWFTKPLRYDVATELVLPDFVLLDGEHARLPMEIYGRADEQYLARREAKRRLYRELYGDDRYWEWIVDPTHPEAIPALPRKRQDLA